MVGRAVSSHHKLAKAEARMHKTLREHSQEHAAPLAPELPELDRLIHERIRLGIVSALATNDSLSFNDLKRVLKTTDGNLSVHARKLEEAQYISCVKFFEPATLHYKVYYLPLRSRRLFFRLPRIRRVAEGSTRSNLWKSIHPATAH